jgi:transposase
VVDLEHETNPERLRRVALLQHAQIKHLLAVVEKKDAQLAKLTGKPANFPLLLAELEAVQDGTAASASADATPAKPADQRKPPPPAPKEKKGHGPSEQPDLEHIVVECKLDEADCTCPRCGGQLVEMAGQFESSQVIDVVEVQYRVVEARLQKYRCGCGACVDTALANDQVPERNVEGGRYSLDFAAKVAIDKYVHHLPLERQTRMMAERGLVVTSQTLWDQLLALALTLKPVWVGLREQALTAPVIGLDQTGWLRLDDRDKAKWQMWCMTTPKLVYHQICDDKSAQTFREVVGDFAGKIVCDQAATHAAGARDGPIVLAGCWAHIYRKFAEAAPNHPEANAMLKLIGELYAVERRATSESELAELRRTESTAILGRIKAWLESVPVIGATALGKAVKHTAKVWPTLRVFLDDPKVWIDNNATERGLRGPVIGRRNHFGSKSRRGTEVAAIMYSLVETAKVIGVDPAKYLVAAAKAARRGVVLLPAAFADDARSSGT